MGAFKLGGSGVGSSFRTLWSNKVQVISSCSSATPKGECVPKETFHWRTPRRLRGELICVCMSYGNFSETFLATLSENSQMLHASIFHGETCCVQIVASMVKSGGS